MAALPSLVSAGVVVVWCGGPRLVAHRLPDDGLIVGRDLIADDPQLQLNHALVEPVRNRIDVSARDGRIELNGRPLTTTKSLEGASFPAFLAAGRSVLALVDDVRPFENLTPVRDGAFVIGSALGPAVRAVDSAANAEDHVSLKGPDAIVRVLARRYADKLGAHAWFRPSGDQHLDHFLSTRPAVRTVVIDLSRPMFDRDIQAIHTLLETDLRFVIVRRDDHYLEWLPPALAADTIDVPRYACDERVLVIAERAGSLTLNAAVVAALLDQAERLTEERWSTLLDRVIESWNDADPPRVETILLHLG